MPQVNDSVVVYTGTSTDANFVKSLLEGDGITTSLLDEMMGTLAPWVIAHGGVGAVKVIVSEKDSDRAKLIIQEFLGKRDNED